MPNTINNNQILIPVASKHEMLRIATDIFENSRTTKCYFHKTKNYEFHKETKKTVF